MSNATPTTAVVKPHPFAHIAPGPYRFVGLETEEDREMTQRERMESGLIHTTNGYTSCDHCSTPIIYCYWFRASNGAEFKVGCDCAEKADVEAHGACKSARKKLDTVRRSHDAALRAAARKALRDVVLAKQAEDAAATVAKLKAAHPKWTAAAAALAVMQGFPGSFASDMQTRLNRGFELTPKQAALLMRLHAENGQPTGDYYGTVGERVAVTVTIVNVADFDTQFGTTFVFSMTTAAGESIVWKTGRPGELLRSQEDVAADDDDSPWIKGEFTLRGTIKAHAEYRGRRQTALSRCKVLSV